MSAHATEERREKRRKLAAIRLELREARIAKKRALLDARERCRADRIAVRERTRALRLRVLRDLKEVTNAERAAAHRACSERMRAAQRVTDRAGRRHAEMMAERKRELDLKRVAKAERDRKAGAPAETCLSCVHETDDAVRANLTSDLVPLFDEVSRSIKGGPKESRTEAFLKFAETHPEKVLETTSHEAHTRVEALESAHRDLTKGSRTSNAYESKKAARLERMRERADRLKRESAGRLESARRIADHIPMGQPILIGHHSEKRHRRDIARIHSGHEKAAELAKAAEALERRADRSERVNAISSDDPDAIEKLRSKLASIDNDRARMAEANRAVRSANPRAALAAIGFSESLIEKALTPDSMGHIGFPPYALRNAAAEASRLRERIKLLEQRATKPTPPTLYGYGVRIEEAENRVRVMFDAKPDEATRGSFRACERDLIG
ncbi:MAG: DUF3560 domain-containing protein [Polyangiaceae bacterium]